MCDLNYQLKNICARNRDGSFSTQNNRQRMLFLIANQLYEMSYRHVKADSLKAKYVHELVEKWTEEGISIGVIKNRIAVLRWWAEKTNNSSVIAKSNDFYGIKNRQFVTNKSKAISVSQGQLEKVKDSYVKVSLELQSDFGLRREEAIKFQPDFADKGGKDRSISIRNEQQPNVLNKVKQLAGKGSLIPKNKRYI